MPKDLYELAVKRDELLLAEIAAWLHMIGKYQDKFQLHKEKDLDIKLPLEIETNYKHLFQFFKHNRNQPFGENYRFLDFIENHRNTKDAKEDKENKFTYIQKLLMDAHGRGSGTDKGILNNNSYKKQEGENRYLSSAFGWEEKALDLELINKKRSELYSYLDKEIGCLEEKLSGSKLSYDDWKKWRDKFCQRLKEEFSWTIADTRYPINDVSLWDQTASTVAFFKVLLANSVLSDITKNPIKDQQRFRVLQIIIGGGEYLSNSVKIADLFLRKNLINDGFNRVKDLLEVEYPLGYEIYRDMDRIAFLVPDIDGLLTVEDSQRTIEDSNCNKELGKLILQYFDEVTEGEISINEIRLSEKGTRNVFYVGNELIKSTGSYSPTAELLQNCWQDMQADRCTICQIRPSGYMSESLERNKNISRERMKSVAYKRKICVHCLKRLAGRSERWATEQKDTTIWLDEVADENGRVALIAAKYDLSRWQNGELISTLKNVTNINENDNCQVRFSDLICDFETGIDELTKLTNFRKIAELYANTVSNLLELQVETEDLNETVYNRLTKSEKLALAIWRKTPSFARIRRIWETTRSFWLNITDGFSTTVGERPSRVKIVGDFIPDGSNEITTFNSYIVETSGGLRFTVVFTGNREFLIGENLQWLALKLGAEKQQATPYNAAVDYVITQLRDEEVYLSEFELMDRRIGKLVNIHMSCDYTAYLPYVEILTEPDRFMAIVPAKKALEVAKAIKKKYCQEMGKVRNRLPVMVGLVFAESHTPLTALLDAGRRMLKMGVQSQETWKIDKIESRDENRYYRIGFENGITWSVPALMGDQEIEDIWYPNFYVRENTMGAKEPQERPTAFKGPHGWLVHVKELIEGDQVMITPSRFDFEFLTSAALRFEIGYDQETGKRLSGPGFERKTSRPYYLEQLDELQDLQEILQEGLNRNQIYQILELIEMKRSEWGDHKDPVFTDFVRDVVRNARWKAKPDAVTVDKLTEAGVKGKLRDVVELYFKICKSDEEVDQDENSGT